MGEKERKEVLAKGEVTLKVKRNSILQNLTFKVVRKKTLVGDVPYLTLDRFLDVSELMRISEEYQLPVESPVGRVYPRGKREMDFAGL